MKTYVDLQKSVTLPRGGASVRYVSGELDANGILWLDEDQGNGVARGVKVKPGTFIHLGSRVTGVRQVENVVAPPAGRKAGWRSVSFA